MPRVVAGWIQVQFFLNLSQLFQGNARPLAIVSADSTFRFSISMVCDPGVAPVLIPGEAVKLGYNRITRLFAHIIARSNVHRNERRVLICHAR